jgi:hypothetical protein
MGAKQTSPMQASTSEMTQRGHRTAKDNIAVTPNFAFSEHLSGNV